MNERNKVKPGASSQSQKKHSQSTIVDDMKKQKKIEDTRKELFDQISSFRDILKDQSLPENKTSTLKERESTLALEMTKKAWELNFENLDEGTMTILSLLLHALIANRDEINKLRFQNGYLAKKLAELRKDVAAQKE